MNKYIILFLFSAVPLALSAQSGNVGVATTAPKTTLDVNGTTNVNNEINFGGTNSLAGNPGAVGEFISANGAANPEWKKFDLPVGYSDALLLSVMYLKSTNIGVTFPGSSGGATLAVPYTENQSLPANWKNIAGVEMDFKIDKPINNVNIFIQTVGQVVGVVAASFGCGIYIDNQLKFVRTNDVTGSSGSYKILNLNTSIPNLSVGNHNFKFACAERNVVIGTTLSIGESQSTATLSTEMAGTSATIKVLEPIQ